jgi:hypothetical protein
MDSQLYKDLIMQEITNIKASQAKAYHLFLLSISPLGLIGIPTPAYYTNKLKKSQLIDYSFADQNPKHYEEDHLIPLSIGGAPEDPLNLWPQTRLSEWDAAKKDVLELRLYKMVCNGEIALDDARQRIANNWIETYKIIINGD